MNRLSALRKFFDKSRKNKATQNFPEKLKRVSSGYVLILFFAVLPVLLLGTKYVLDQSTINNVKIEKEDGTGNFYKACAREAALAVAKNWNPGLNLSYQKNALMKIADAVYNDNVTKYGGSGILGQAVLGIDLKKSPKAIKDKNKFMPLKVSWDQISTLAPGTRMIEYTDATKYLLRYYRGYYTSDYNGNGGVYGNTYFRMWRETDLNTAPSYRYSNFDEIDETERAKQNYVLKHHDIYGLPCMGYVEHFTNYPYYPTNGYFWPGCSSYHSTWVMTIPSTSSSVSQYYPWKYNSSSSTTGINNTLTTTYKTRTTPSGTDPVTITVDSDRIKVTTDSSTGYQGTVGYAQPAQCNVDIVLAIPVNGAASNTSNNDAASATAGTPMTSSEYGSHTYPTQTTPAFSSNTTGTPLYQMGQACKNFVKDNFYHIKGVTMGLIPYSAKVSISPDKASSYTIAIPQFVEYTTTNPHYPTAAMYGTSGEKDAPLVQSYKTTAIGSGQTLPTTDTPYYWGGMLTGCPIMCRRGSTTTWYNTQLAYGNLLYNGNPTGSNNYRYMRMNLNPCLAGYANQLSMKCERKCTHFFPNPYYMIEPTSDMVKIYEMCNAIFPIYDPNNVSNFLFIPFEWANNFWQSWTSNVTTSAGTDTLSRPSKTTSGRKKALVMLVNKPDWFEPGEMTYLGFDNDYSAVPLAESDKIDFSINYSDTSKKFLDGTSYDGTPRGPKKIIRYATQSGTIARNSSGDFECSGSGTGRLYIPRQAMVRLTVKNRGNNGNFSGNPDWKYYSQKLNPSGYTSYTSYWGSYYWSSRFDSLLTYGNGKFVCFNRSNNVSAYSYDGVTWYRGTSPGTTGWCGLTWNGSYFVAITTSKYVSYSADGINWQYYGTAGGTLNTCLCQGGGLIWDGARFYIVNDSGYAYTTTSLTGTSSWSQVASSGCRYSSQESTAYGNGYYVQYYNGYVRYSTNGTSWTNVGQLAQAKYGSMTFGGGKFFIICGDGTVIYASNPTSTSNWTYLDGAGASTSSLYSKSGRSDWTSICYGSGKLVAVSQYGDVAVLEDNTTPGTIQFTNIGDTTTHTIRDEKTFTIPAANVTSTSGSEYYVEFNVSNLKLISAEVTNLNYTYANPINTSYNEVEMIGPSGSSANMSWGTRTESVSERWIYHYSDGHNNGNFSMSHSNMNCYHQNYGWYTNKDSQGSVTITSDTNATVNLYVQTYTPNGSSGGSMTSGNVNWKYYSNALNREGPSVSTWNYCCDDGYRGFAMAYGSGRFAVISAQGYTAYSNDGVTWYRGTNVGQGGGYNWNGMAWSGSYFVALTGYGGYVTYSSNGSSWSTPTQALSGVYTGHLDDDLGWNGSYFFAKGDDNNMYMTSYSTGTSGWYNNGSVSALGDGEQWKYGGGYYARFYPQNGNFRYGSSVMSVNSSYTLPLAPRALNYGPGYWVIITNYGAIMKSSSACPNSWSIIDGGSSSSTLYSLSGKRNWCGICYGGGKWVAYTRSGDVAVLGGTSYETPYVKINGSTYNNPSGYYNVSLSWNCSNQRYEATVYLYNAYLYQSYQLSGSKTYPALFANNNYSVTYSYNDCNGNRQVTTGSTSSYDSSLGKYYLQLPRNSTPKFAARKYSVTEAVYDMIDFSANTTSNKNGYLSSSFGDSYGSGFYYVGSSSVNRTLTTSRKGRLELKVAPSFYADSGYIKMNYGSNTSAQTITAPTTLSMKYSDLSSGTMQFTLYNCVILYAKLCDAEATIGSPSSSNSQNLMWNTSSISTSGTNISLSGSYSNWYADEGWHKLTNSSFLTWNNSYVSDITSVLDAKSPIFAYWYMPQNVYTDYTNTNLVGPMRLFAPITRDSSLTPRKYCQMYATSSTYSNKANLMWHNFSLPLNYVLYRAGYQSAGGDATAAVRSATAAVCAKLKTDYGSNLRVYIVKYRKQAQYKTFPNYNVTQSNADHTYSTIDACATSSNYVYDVSTEANLKSTLNTIANDIKNFAGGVTAARNVD